IGNGSNTSQLQNTILLLKYMKVGPDIHSLIKVVYPNIEQENLTDDFLRDRMLLSARNDNVQDINSTVLDIFPGYKCTYLSADNIIIEDGADNTNIYSIDSCLIVVQFSDHVIEACILSGSCAGNLAFIPHITLTPSSTELPFKFKRRQFPV
ncbi:15328_t:CDS:2, partial [Gigaspora margarita]